MGENRWLFSVDRGGTFTDVVGFAPDGTVHTRKLLSRSTRYDEAAIEGIRLALNLTEDEPIPAARVAEIRMGTTVATNGLLERQGEPTVLVITRGFGDLLEIGDQARPRLFDLAVTKPSNLYSAVVEIDERIGSDGKVIRPLDEEGGEEALRKIYASGLRSIAIALLHSWVAPRHERRLGAIAARIGFDQISLSHQTLDRIRLVGRGRTTLVDAYLSPLLRAYVSRIEKEVGNIPLSFMQSSGGLTAAKSFCGKEAILSGPAGGVVAVAALAEKTGVSEVIGFDMGGTSTDVCRYGGSLERAFENETAGIRFSATTLAIETVAAGGGSILTFDGVRMLVGPDSAGASPGPCCYGRGGPLTLTDANVALGRIHPEDFPHTCGLEENEPLHGEATRAAFATRTTEINRALNLTLTPEEVALGYIRIANEIMAQPIKRLSITRGYDVRRHTLCAFGGAGGLHACAIARSLGMRRVVVDRFASLYSAYGIALADHLKMRERTILRPFTREEYGALDGVAGELGVELRTAFRAEGRDPDEGEMRGYLDIRPVGADTFLTIRDEGYAEAQEAFGAQFLATYGFAPDRERLEIVNIRLELVIKCSVHSADFSPAVGKTLSQVLVGARFLHGFGEIPCFALETLLPGTNIPSPSLLVSEQTAILVEPGFSGHVDESGRVWLELLTEESPGEEKKQDGSAAFDPVTLELFAHAFMALAEQMGETLRNSAHSVNIKERLDFSCALFDGDGRLVANAPHVPVHLGAMGESVRGLIAARTLRPGQTWVSNHPAKGGSHLPDITVMTPVFIGDANRPDFFVANRGHHADIGGLSPGSLSPFCERLVDEGVILDNIPLVCDGQFREAEIRQILSSGDHPARNSDERISDLTAQIAANHKGVTELQRLVASEGLPKVIDYMGRLRDVAEEAVQMALRELLDGEERWESSYADSLDDGSVITVKLTITSGAQPALTVDFTGSSPESPVSLNTPTAVVRAAVLYTLRTLVTRDLPLNDGCMAPVTLILPERSLLSPSPDRAVAGGNVETSQRIVDVLLGALGVAAASQGTMNNVTFGFDDQTGFYETIAGGSGATKGREGASGVQVHMTNTRITDPEVLEHRFPGVRIRTFSLRRGSGGAGMWRGGDGVIREYDILTPCEVTLFGERRVTEPYGVAGGEPGARAINTLVRDGVARRLDGHTTAHLRPGDLLRVETPGGGGFGQGI